MATVRQLLDLAAELPVDSPERDAQVLLCHCLDKPRSWLFAWPEADVDMPRQQHFKALLAERRRGVPVAYLTGQREFWSLPLAVNEHTLIPRPETELLVEWALELPLPGDASVLDLGTGTGAIALAVASERPHWRVQGVDASEAALEVARDNARRCQLERVVFKPSNWFQALAGQRFRLLLSNPPYIDPRDPHLACGDVRFEPPSALVAAGQGLADIEAIVSAASQYLEPGGWLLLEHGYQQGEQVRALLQAAGFTSVATRRDLGDHERISGGCWHVE